jgi:hypothetical protein
MKTKILVCALLVLGLTSGMAFAEQAPQRVFDLAKGDLAAIGVDPVIVEAVKAQNATERSLDEIQQMDENWKTTNGIASFMQALMDSKLGKHLRMLQESQSYYGEILVMDNQGANVGMTDKTSDYWHGDEAKFQKSFANGEGAIFVDEVEFYESEQAYLAVVSVPVVDEGKAIGVTTFFINIDQIE